MDIKLFSKIVKGLGEQDLEDFSCIYGGKTYGFSTIGDDSWDDQGKYQYRTEEGILIEMDENYNEIRHFNFGALRTVQRSGSYFSDYYYENEPYEFYEITQVLIPEVVIPAHTEPKWNKLNIDFKNVVNDEEEERERIEAEKIKLEEEAKAEKERLAKLYPMNKHEIILMVNKNFKKRKIEKFTISDMRREYFDIVVAKKLESQDWIDYYKAILEIEGN